GHCQAGAQEAAPHQPPNGKLANIAGYMGRLGIFDRLRCFLFVGRRNWNCLLNHGSIPLLLGNLFKPAVMDLFSSTARTITVLLSGLLAKCLNLPRSGCKAVLSWNRRPTLPGRGLLS